MAKFPRNCVKKHDLLGEFLILKTILVEIYSIIYSNLQKSPRKSTFYVIFCGENRVLHHRQHDSIEHTAQRAADYQGYDRVHL